MIVLYRLTSLRHPLGVTMTNDVALIKSSCLFRRCAIVVDVPIMVMHTVCKGVCF